ncbi:Uncharacterized protein APZ42_004717, partial [Daphnia magna]
RVQQNQAVFRILCQLWLVQAVDQRNANTFGSTRTIFSEDINLRFVSSCGHCTVDYVVHFLREDLKKIKRLI